MELVNKMPDKFTDHIFEHRRGVADAWENRLRPVLEAEGFSEMTLFQISSLVSTHDISKITDTIEYYPYSRRYMDPENNPKDSDEYRKAWNHHQKSNPHHWQYWVLMEDIENPKITALPMEFIYIIEMLCDWQSASIYYGNTAHWWYETQKENMILHPHTIEVIEKYIKYLD